MTPIEQASEIDRTLRFAMSPPGEFLAGIEPVSLAIDTGSSCSATCILHCTGACGQSSLGSSLRVIFQADKQFVGQVT